MQQGCIPVSLKAKDAAKYYGISISNLRKWAREGRVETEITKGGRYNYIIRDVKEQCPEQVSKDIIYARVSSKKQQNDLQRQITLLQRAFPNSTLITDIGSGINFKRKGFRTIMELLFQRKISSVMVAYKDRFSRFGFEFFQWMFNEFGATLNNIKTSEQNSNEELADDLMEVITVFTARYYGKRKYKNGEDKSISEQSSEDSIQEMLERFENDL
jgi:predicted site-specific integrase-resolvase